MAAGSSQAGPPWTQANGTAHTQHKHRTWVSLSQLLVTPGASVIVHAICVCGIHQHARQYSHCLLYCITAVAGRWCNTAKSKTVVDPLNGEAFMTIPDTQVNEIDHFIQSLQACSKSGLHNPLKNPERCEKPLPLVFCDFRAQWHPPDACSGGLVLHSTVHSAGLRRTAAGHLMLVPNLQLAPVKQDDSTTSVHESSDTAEFCHDVQVCNVWRCLRQGCGGDAEAGSCSFLCKAHTAHESQE